MALIIYLFCALRMPGELRAQGTYNEEDTVPDTLGRWQEGWKSTPKTTSQCFLQASIQTARVLGDTWRGHNPPWHQVAGKALQIK